jgi:diacylglycerol O-acyltransferase / wax synthase
MEAVEEMAPVDALLMHGDSDPRKRSSLIGLCLLERAPHWSDLMAAVERTTRTVPRLRQRVVSPLLPVSRPHWVADPDFELGYHLRHVRIPDPGGFPELMTLTELAAMAPLDQARPLWELTLVEGLRTPGSPHERAALLWKFSHALGDGVGVLRIALSLLDREPHPTAGRETQHSAAPAAGGKSRLALLRDRLIELPADLTLDAVRSGAWVAAAGWRVASDPRGVTGEVVGFARSLRRLVTPPAAAPSPAMRTRGTKRRLLVHEVPLEQLKRAGRMSGGSINDAYLSAVLGAMRRYHEALGVPVERLPMAVPVYGRRGAATGLAAVADAPGGNHFSAVRFAAPVAEADPVARMREVRALVTAGRNEPAHGATEAVARVFARTPAVLLAEIARQQGQLDVQASNVAGFPSQVYLAGVAVDGMYSFGPAPGVAVMFVLVSYNGTGGIGVTLDEAAIADPELFAWCVTDGFDEVLRLADPPPASRPVRKAPAAAAVNGSRRAD